MDPRLKRAIDRYQSGIREVIRLMEASGMSVPRDLGEWMDTRDKLQIGKFVGGIRYFIHGYGIAVSLPSGGVDFDFGPNGEIDRIDKYMFTDSVLRWKSPPRWKSALTRKSRRGYEIREELLADFDEAVKAGDFVHIEANVYVLRS